MNKAENNDGDEWVCVITYTAGLEDTHCNLIALTCANLVGCSPINHTIQDYISIRRLSESESWGETRYLSYLPDSMSCLAGPSKA